MDPDCGHQAAAHVDSICKWIGCKCAGLLAGLTQRERAILVLLIRGDAIKDIATTLDISVKTVEAHKLNIYSKTGAHSRFELVVGALRQHIVELADLPELHVRIGVLPGFTIEKGER